MPPETSLCRAAQPSARPIFLLMVKLYGETVVAFGVAGRSCRTRSGAVGRAARCVGTPAAAQPPSFETSSSRLQRGRLMPDRGRLDAEPIDEEAPEICPFLDLLRGGLARAVASFGVDADQDRCRPGLRVL